jgi:hypothetical protein
MAPDHSIENGTRRAELPPEAGLPVQALLPSSEMSPPWGIVRELNAEVHPQLTVINVTRAADRTWLIDYFDPMGTHFKLVLENTRDLFPYKEAVGKLRLLSL